MFLGGGIGVEGYDKFHKNLSKGYKKTAFTVMVKMTITTTRKVTAIASTKSMTKL